MEKFFKVPCNLENNNAKLKKSVNKDDIIGEVEFNDMFTTLNYTKENILLTDPIYLTLNMIVNTNTNPIMKELSPELVPVLYNDKTLDKFKGTPLYSMLKGHIHQVKNKVRESVKEVQDINAFLNYFMIIYSIIISKGININLNEKPTLCFFPILNKIQMTYNKNDVNCGIDLKNNKFYIKALKDISTDSYLYLPYNLTPSFELNFIKFGIFPDNFDATTINLSFKEYNICLAKEMKNDDKIMLRRIRKNPKYADLKKELQTLFKENIKELENNKTQDNIIREYLKHVLKLYKDNYPK